MKHNRKNYSQRGIIVNAMLVAAIISVAQIPPPGAIYPRECDCPVQRLDDSYCRAAMVFEGVALDGDTTIANGDIGKYDERDVIEVVHNKFRVSAVHKGEPLQHVTVITAHKDDPCGFNFISGEKYLVFAYKEDEGLATDRCTSTRNMDTITEELRDSLHFVMDGNRYEGGVPLDEPCN